MDGTWYAVSGLRSFNELLQNPRAIKALAIGGAALGLLIVGLLLAPLLVRGRIEREARARGFEALVNALGWVNAVRFVQQYEASGSDYTAEREAFLPAWDAGELARRVGQQQGKQERR